MKRFLGLLLCAALLSGLLSACQEEKTSYVPTGDGLTWDEATQPVDPEPTAQTLSLTYYADRSLNPYRCGDYTNRTLFSLVYQGLFSVDKDYQAQPVLCASYYVSADMRTWTFYPENATFSDGTVLTAADVAASLSAAVESSYYGGRFGYVEEVSATDDGGVEVKLTTPYEDLPVLLDVPIVKASEVAADRPLGTGPYLYEAHEDKFWLRLRSDWWCQAQLPLTAEYVPLVTAEDPAQIRDTFEFSDLGLVCADPGAENYAEFHSDYELWDCESGVFLYLACNRDSEVFSVDAVRQALTFAIDRDALAGDYYRSFAYSAVLPASPQSPYYDTALAAQYGYDPSKLTMAVSDSDLREADVVLLVNNGDSIRLRAARQIAAMLEECGLDVTMSELTGEDYLTALENGEYDLHLGQTKLAPNMDLSAFFDPEGALNFGGLGDVATYALCLDALANSGNYFTLYQRILEDGALCPILFRSYAIYADRGLFTTLDPARDNVFYYSLGKSLEDVKKDPPAEPEPTEAPQD